MLYDLTVIKSKGGTTFVCGFCNVPGVPALGATDKAELRHLLICSKCSRTMGEWLTLEDREKELGDFAAKLARPA
jgi:hypothetical protein